MRILTGFTALPDQRLTHRLETGENVNLRFTFKARAAMWFVDITYGTKQFNGLRLSNYFNILRQYRNNIPFGLLPIIDNESEPLLINDLQTERVRIGVLNAEEVQSLEDGINASADANAGCA